MKNYINKSAKRAISLALAFVLLIGTLFTANVGVNIKAGAETTDSYADWDNVQCWEGNYLSDYSSFKQEDVDGDGVKEYIIENAAQLQFAAAGTRSRNTNWPESSLGKKFVIDPTVDAFIMQPKEVVDKLGIAAFVELSGAEETREFFEETYTAAGYTPVNWVKDSNALIFSGDFDGSGVPIYGIYADGIARGNEHAAFFLVLNAGGTDTTYTDITLENIVIKNSYFKSYRRTGILTSIVWGDNNTCTKVDSCVFGNCYLFGQNLYTKGTTTYLRSSKTDSTITEDISAMGIVASAVSGAPIQMSNSLVYGNGCRYDFYTATAISQDNSGNLWEYTVNDTSTITGPTTTYDTFNWVFSNNKNNGEDFGSIKNCIILDTVVNNLEADKTDYCSNVYSDTSTSYTTVTKLFDGESTKGSAGMYWMRGLNWGNDWFAVEGEYPSPFKPDNYDSNITASVTGYNGGNGTKDDPYIISSADQLYQMATEQSYSEIKTDNWDLYTSAGVADPKTTDNYVSKYYKVADGVDAIYINDVETKAEVEALVAKGGYNYWNPKNETASGAFSGNFDGNGVTIYGMISTSTGFVNKIDGSDAAVKNVHFKAAHVSTSGRAAVVTTDFSNYGVSGYVYNTETAKYEQVWETKNSAYTIANVVVTESYIATTRKNEGKKGDAIDQYLPTAGGIVAVETTPPLLKMEYCLFDGGSCTLIDGDDATANYNENSSKAGIVSTVSNNTNNWELSNCVSIGASAVSMQTGGYYGRYKSGAIKFNAVYGIYNDALSKADYPVLANIDNIEGTTFSMIDMPLLNWGGAWTLETLADSRTIPMPKTSDKAVDAYSTQLAKQNNGGGMNNVTTNEGYAAGKYGRYKDFTGSGTKEDPYIISNALQLATAIACGGKNQYSKLYYKLSCDIDVGASWINEQTIEGKYVYVPFEGHIDGDGHTIYNLYSVGEKASLIPQIKGGASIKNLHIRNSNIVVGDDVEGKGAFFGELISGGTESKVTLEGCSFEGAGVADGVKYLTGNLGSTKIKNSYAIYNGTPYYYIDYHYTSDSADDRSAPTPENAVFYTGDNADTAVWYKGGKDDCKPQLVNRAKAMTEVDISGYGDNDYDTNDIASLRQRLLDNPAYAYVYGDVSRNGVTNMGDLAILARQLVGTYNMYADGFWRNAALGNIVIYYGENDNYDFARKLELALEDAFGKDVKKVVVGTGSIDSVSYGSKSGGLYVHKNDIYTNGTNYYKFSEDASTGAINYQLISDTNEIAKYKLDGNCQIVVGNIDIASGTDYTSPVTDADKYQITYKKSNAEVWLQGGSFTAVEQAMIDFINNSNPNSSFVYTADGAVQSLAKNAPEKVAKTVGTNTYHYAWGDEFKGDELKLDTWRHAVMHNETTANEDGRFTNLEVAYADDMAELYKVADGKLSIWRGYYGDGSDIANTKWGYKYLGTMADNIGVNEFSNGKIEDGDIYVTAGKIDSSNSVLAKQGYIEFNVLYPSDGNVFACLWMYGVRLGQTNANLSDGLYGKVLKLNNAAAYADGTGAGLAWDGTTNKMDSRSPSTYKYQMPIASYEIDIVELMQSGSGKMTNTYKTANFTFHKYHDGGVYTDEDGIDKIKFINWDTLLAGGDTYFSVPGRMNVEWSGLNMNYVYDKSNNTIDTFLHGTTSKWSYTSGYYTWNGGTRRSETDDGTIFSATTNTVNTKDTMMKVGVEWDTTAPNTMLFKFYIDDVQVGNPVTEDIKYDEDKAFSALDSATGFVENLTKLLSDGATANQYMYLLIDNTIFSSEKDGSRDTTKILTQENGDTAVMEIDYVRIYQKDGKRDIVTPETEDFNNGNHFGY